MDREHVLFLSVVLIIGTLLGAVSIATNTGSSSGATATGSVSSNGNSGNQSPKGRPIEGVFTPCYNGPLSLDTSVNWANKTVNVLQLDPGRSGYLCLDYQFKNGAPSGFTPNLGLTGTSSSNDVFSAFLCGAQNGTELFACPGIHVSTAVLAGTNKVGVNITADSAARQGVYWLQLQPCSPTVFIIGQPPSKLSADAAGATLSCITSLNAPTVRIVGLLGIRVLALSVGT